MGAVKLRSPLERHAGRIVWELSVAWTALVAVSLFWNLHQITETAMDLARVAARTSFTKDVVYRAWSAGHGGVYVPTTPGTPPNPYLTQIEERDLTTPSGRSLTLINPAYMTRQVHELGAKHYGVRSHITSLNPLRPENAPDPWEAKALRAFSQGQAEVSEVVPLEGLPHMRLMRPLLTERSCLKCHAKQGHREGDLRGGISLAVALQPYQAAVWSQALPLALSHGLIWLLGLVAFHLGGTKIKQQLRQRSQDEKALRQSEQKFRLLYDNAPMGYQSLDEDGLIVEVNQTWLEMLGYAREEVIGRWFGDFLAPGDVDHFLKNFPCFKDAGEICDVQFEMVRRDGSSITASFNGRIAYDAQGRFLKTHCLFNDITGRKQAEAALRESEEKYRTLFEESFDGLFITSPAGKIIDMNKKGVMMFGYDTKEEMLDLDLEKDVYVDPEDRQRILALISAQGTGEYEISVKKKNGTLMVAHCSLTAEKDKEGKILSYRGIIRDITERKRAEEALLKSEEKYRFLVNKIPAAVFTGYGDWSVDFFDRKIEALTGYPKEEFDSRKIKWSDLILPEDLPEARQAFIEALKTTKSYLREYRIRKKDGEISWIQALGGIFCDDAGKVDRVSGVFLDITERKKAEEERLRFVKLESLATLAGGIAHDFNNILTAIMGNISLASLELQKEERSWERLAAAEKACLQAQTLAGQLLTFAKGGAPIKKIVTLEKIVTESISFASSGSAVQRQLSFPDNLWAVEADPGQANQVFQNLIINAIQAMPTGGTIQVRGENLVVPEESDLPLKAGRYVRISIQDQGVGMPADYLPKIFDPYFTTKQKGSGLGLATAYSIVKNHQGHIAVESKLGLGTVFHVYFPAAQREMISPPEEKIDVFSGRGRILVMDDEDTVRHVLAKMLGYLGYETEFARNGDEAIELFTLAQESGAAFDAVILDLTVPGGMGGKEAMEQLLKIDPRVKAIVSSGYSHDPIMAEFEKYGFSGVIAKPYRVSELSKVINKVVKRKRGIFATNKK